jgi:hypothetical protein
MLQRMGPPAYPSSAGPCSALHVSRVRGTLKEEGDQTVSIKIRLQRPNTTTSRSLVYNHQDHRLMVSLTLRERLSVSLHHKAQLLRREKAWGHHSTGSEAEVLELDYQGHFQSTRSARNHSRKSITLTPVEGHFTTGIPQVYRPQVISYVPKSTTNPVTSNKKKK